MNKVKSFNERVRAQKLLVFDIGKNEATYCKLGDSKAQTIDVSDITKIVMEYPGYAMTVEDCHMAPRTRKSMSQHYTEPKLNAFYKTAEHNDVVCMNWPQKLTPKALSYSKLEKSDEYDPVAIAQYLHASRTLDYIPEVKLKLPPTSYEYSKKDLATFAMREDRSILINYLRSNEDGAYKDYALGKSDPVVERIINLIPELLEVVSLDVAHFLGIANLSVLRKPTTYNKDKGSREFVAPAGIYNKASFEGIRFPVLRTLMCCFIGQIKEDETGDLYVSSDFIYQPAAEHEPKKLMSWSYASGNGNRHKGLWGFCPWHQNAGVMASDLKHWGLKSVIFAYCKSDDELKKLSKSKQKEITIVAQAINDSIQFADKFLKTEDEEKNSGYRNKLAGEQTPTEMRYHTACKQYFRKTCRTVFNFYRERLSSGKPIKQCNLSDYCDQIPLFE